MPGRASSFLLSRPGTEHGGECSITCKIGAISELHQICLSTPGSLSSLSALCVCGQETHKPERDDTCAARRGRSNLLDVCVRPFHEQARVKDRLCMLAMGERSLNGPVDVLLQMRAGMGD